MSGYSDVDYRTLGDCSEVDAKQGNKHIAYLNLTSVIHLQHQI